MPVPYIGVAGLVATKLGSRTPLTLRSHKTSASHTPWSCSASPCSQVVPLPPFSEPNHSLAVAHSMECRFSKTTGDTRSLPSSLERSATAEQSRAAQSSAEQRAEQCSAEAYCDRYSSPVLSFHSTHCAANKKVGNPKSCGCFVKDHQQGRVSHRRSRIECM